MTTNQRGSNYFRTQPSTNIPAFSEAEKQALGLVGLVPDVTEAEDLQLSRVMMQLSHKNTDLQRYI